MHRWYYSSRWKTPITFVGSLLQLPLVITSPQSMGQGKRRFGRSPSSLTRIVLVCLWSSWIPCQKHSQGTRISQKIKFLNLTQKKKIRKTCSQQTRIQYLWQNQKRQQNLRTWPHQKLSWLQDNTDPPFKEFGLRKIKWSYNLQSSINCAFQMDWKPFHNK